MLTSRPEILCWAGLAGQWLPVAGPGLGSDQLSHQRLREEGEVGLDWTGLEWSEASSNKPQEAQLAVTVM